eukprot:827900-Pyramimonas_sp.AAC.1
MLPCGAVEPDEIHGASAKSNLMQTSKKWIALNGRDILHREYRQQGLNNKRYPARREAMPHSQNIPQC